jgi:hypothetical protein
MSNENKVFRENGPGWESLIAPLEARVEKLGGTVQQIKEKFGRLRFYYDAAETDSPQSDAAWSALDADIEQAERDSARMCEMCGAPGVLMTSGSWLKTLCPEHSLELGYKKRAST